MKDTTNEIFCPACGKPMKKIYLEEQKFNIDICLDGCGGIFLDNRELKKIDEEHEDITPVLEAIKGKTFEKTDSSKIRVCPACGNKMVKNYTSHLRKIEIDECYGCGGKFLDYGELAEIRREYKNEKERVGEFDKYIQSIIPEIGEDTNNKRKKTISSMLSDVMKYYGEFE